MSCLYHLLTDVSHKEVIRTALVVSQQLNFYSVDKFSGGNNV